VLEKRLGAVRVKANRCSQWAVSTPVIVQNDAKNSRQCTDWRPVVFPTISVTGAPASRNVQILTIRSPSRQRDFARASPSEHRIRGRRPGNQPKHHPHGFQTAADRNDRKSCSHSFLISARRASSIGRWASDIVNPVNAAGNTTTIPSKNCPTSSVRHMIAYLLDHRAPGPRIRTQVTRRSRNVRQASAKSTRKSANPAPRHSGDQPCR